MSSAVPHDPLHRCERWFTGLLLFSLVAFGVLVEIRSVFLERRMGDVGVFLRRLGRAYGRQHL